MANIYIDVRELPLRMHDIPGWLRRGDEVFITDGLKPAFRLLAADAEVTVPKPPPDPRPRVFGLFEGMGVVPPDFNEPLPPEFWSGGESIGCSSARRSPTG